MFYEETNPPDIEESVILAAIRFCFPQIKEPKVRFHYHGTYNVYIAEDKYIFRFPSSYHPPSRRREFVHRDIKVFKLLKGRFTYPIPEPVFTELELDTPYMGYKMIPGVSLSTLFLNATPEQVKFAGEQTGQFLGELHSIDEALLEDEAGSFTPEDFRKEQSKFFKDVQKLTFPNMTYQQRDWTETLFHDFLESDKYNEVDPVIVHGDFDISNILVEPKTFRVTGIIDFEDIQVYDPAVDFVFLREGTDFLTSMIQAYPHRIDPHLRQRVTYLLGKQPFFYILKGLDFGIDAMVSFGYKILSEYISNWKYYMKVSEQSFGHISQ
ncbi:MAG: phosphotransferase family protein [Candidatus Thorarchaeota archaeon]|jgi:aminoglycoside 2''-phosphotransferase